MGLAKTKSKISVAEYLAGERESLVKYEYIDGEVYAVAGTSRRHNVVAGNLFALLHGRLRGGPCEPFLADVKVYVAAVNCFYYPDLMVGCDPTDDDPYYLTQPVLLVEVLSPSTARVDRHEKLSSYQTLDSLQEYLILAQDHIGAVLYRRNAAGWWDEYEFDASDELFLASVDLRLLVAELYAGVRLGEAAPEEIE